MKKKILIAVVIVIAAAVIVTYQMMFAFPDTAAGQPGAGLFVIRNKANGKMIRPEGANDKDGVAMEIYTARPWSCGVWQLHPKETGFFVLENTFSGKTLAADNNNKGSILEITQTPLLADTALSPKYKFIQTGENIYRIENGAGLCITADEKETNGSTHLKFSPWQDTDNQKWQIVKAPSRIIGPTAKK